MSRSSVLEPAASDRTATAPTQWEEGAAPTGPAAAVVLAAGLGSLALGLLSVLTAASSSIASALTLSDRVGELSGVTSLAAAVFFGAWVLLAVAWRHGGPPLGRVAAVTALLVALGLLGTFPPFFNTIGG